MSRIYDEYEEMFQTPIMRRRGWLIRLKVYEISQEMNRLRPDLVENDSDRGHRMQITIRRANYERLWYETIRYTLLVVYMFDFSPYG